MCFLSGFYCPLFTLASNCFSVGSDTKLHRLWPPGDRNLHFQIFKPSFWPQYLLCALQDDGDSEDEHDDSESDGCAGGDDEHNDDRVLLLPMTGLSLSQVTRSASHMLAISG